MPNGQDPDSSSGAHSSISRTLDLKGIIIFLSSAYAFLNYNTRHVIKFTLSGWSLFLVWHILLVTYPAIPPPSLTKTPFSSGDGEHSSRIEIKIGLSQNGIHCSTLPITNVAVAERLSSGKWNTKGSFLEVGGGRGVTRKFYSLMIQKTEQKSFFLLFLPSFLLQMCS